MTNVLLTAHAPSHNTRLLAQACAHGMHNINETCTIITKTPLNTTPQDVLNCTGLIIGTTENIGYMGGLTKDFFDRGYNQWIEHTDGLPVAIYVRAGLDGTATAQILTKLTAALKWKLIQPILILHGNYDQNFETQLTELGATMVAGIENKIF